MLSLTQRESPHQQARIPNRHDSSTEEFGACHANVISTPHDSIRQLEADVMLLGASAPADLTRANFEREVPYADHRIDRYVNPGNSNAD